MTSVSIESWTHVMDEVYRDSWDTGLTRHRSPFVFRGVSDSNHALMSSLVRLALSGMVQEPCPPDQVDRIARLEGHLIRNFRKYAYSQFPHQSIWHWLAVAAHHALPTRLLDWTFSPLVALHFATTDANCYDRDGVVWCVSHRETNTCLPPVLREQLEIHGSDVFTVEMLESAVRSLEDLRRLKPEQFVLFLEPPSLDARIVNQFALFSVTSSPDQPLDVWLGENTRFSRKLIIPAALKWEMRDKLDQAGITERVLFPGLDGLTAWLTRYYAPRRGVNPD